VLEIDKYMNIYSYLPIIHTPLLLSNSVVSGLKIANLKQVETRD